MLRGKRCQSNEILLSDDLIDDGGREHMARDVPGQSGNKQYGKRD